MKSAKDIKVSSDRLGTVQRWREISARNCLLSPFVTIT